jgi:CheY-like chemotaxis protein
MHKVSLKRYKPRFPSIWGEYPIQGVAFLNESPLIIGMSAQYVEPAKRSLQVLHLEDDLTDAELIRAELEENHIPCSVTLIASAHEFATTLRARGVDLVLSDSSVPGFDTLSALKQIREQRREVPFIFISDNSSPKLRAEAFRLGAADFISKSELFKLPRIITSLFFAKAALRPESPLPEIGVPVIVQCEEYRCLGFLGMDGKWRDFCSSVELPPVFSWSEV